jgi:hypothetical protein
VSAGYSPASRAALSDAAGARCSFAADTSVATPSGEPAIASLHIGDSMQARPDPTARRLPVKVPLPASLPRSVPPLGRADLDGSLPLVRCLGHEPGGARRASQATHWPCFAVGIVQTLIGAGDAITRWRAPQPGL